jgi:outer membrane protein TolC
LLKILFTLFFLIVTGISHAESVNSVNGRVSSLSLLDAIETSIKNNSNLKISRLISDANKENIIQEQSRFDTLIFANTTINESENAVVVDSLGVISIENSTQSISMGAQKLLKFGATVSLSSTANIAGDKFLGTEANNTSNTSISLSIDFPLWKGRGSAITLLPIELEKLSFQAGLADLKNQVDINILQTITNYMYYRGATETLTLLKVSEDRSRDLLLDIQTLIDADKMPRSELNKVKAQLSQRIASRIQGEQRVVEAQLNLATVMGVPLNVLRNTSPTDPLMSTTDFEQLETLHLDSLTKKTELKRNDFSAINLRMKVAKKNIILAKDAMKPNLNLVLGAGMKKFNDNNVLYSNLSGPGYGPDLSVQLNFQWYPNQTSAASNTRVAKYNYQRMIIEKEELRRSTRAELETTLFSIVQTGRNYHESKGRKNLSEKNIQNERKKYKLGSATTLDVLTIEEQLNQSKLNLVQLQISYGVLLAKLLYLTGNVGTVSDNTLVLDGLLNKTNMIEILSSD